MHYHRLADELLDYVPEGYVFAGRRAFPDYAQYIARLGAYRFDAWVQRAYLWQLISVNLVLQEQLFFLFIR